MNPSKVTNQIVLVGHPCCDEKYLAEVFSSHNHDVRYGEWGKDGVIDWAIAPNPLELKQLKTFYTPGGVIRPITDEQHLIHYVRDPLQAIPSIISNDSSYWYKYRKRILFNKYNINIDDYSLLNAAVVSFLLWNKIIEEQNPGFVVRIEGTTIPMLEYTRDKLGWQYGQLKNIQQSDYNSDKNTVVVWSELRSDLLQAVDKWCFQYGYEKLSNKIPPVEDIKIVDKLTELLTPELKVLKPVVLPQPVAISTNQQIFGPRNRNVRIQSDSVSKELPPNIRPRIMHTVTVQTQDADLSRRQKQRTTGFSVRGK